MTRMPDTITEQVVVPPRGGGGGAPPSGGAGLTGADLVRILRQRLPLIVFLWLLVIAMTVGGTAMWIKYWPGYKATGAIRLVSINPQPLLEKGADPLHVDLMERLLEDQTVLLKDYGILTETLKDAAVRETTWFQSYDGDVDRALIDLREELVCTPRRGTSYVEVSMTCSDPKDPKVIVDTILSRYNVEAERRARSRYDDELQAIRQEVEGLDEQLRSMREARSAFMTQMAAAGALSDNSAVTERYRYLGYQRSLAAQEERAARTEYEYYAAGQPQEIAVSPEMQQMIEETPSVATLQQRVNYLDEDRKVALQEGFLPNHRGVRAMDARAETAQLSLDQLREEKTAELQQYQIHLARVRWLTAAETLTSVEDQFYEAEAAQRDLDAKQATYFDMLAEEEQTRRYYELRKQYQQELEVAIRTGETFRVQLIAANPPKERSVPRWKLNVPVGTVMGLFMALGLAVLLEFVDTSVRTGRDVVRHVNIPTLGMVPDLDDEEAAIEDIMRAVRDAPTSMVSEAFRTIRTNLQLSAPAERQRSIMVTSSKPEDGKTAVAVNLAVAIANNHRRVLLIDANFRRPALHEVFSASTQQGLSSILSGQTTLESAVVPSGVERLDMLCAGRVPPNPAERLGSPEMRALIDEATKKYDQVIVDTPPLLLVSDALVVADTVDGVILVCRAKANTRGIVQRARDRLYDVNAWIIGAVLNAAQVRRGGYFREQFREYYDYQADQPVAAVVDVPRPTAEEDDKPEPS